jgi:acyl-CoA dehydrogenase
MATAVHKHEMREFDPFERIEDLLPEFAARCAAHDANDEFVSENFAALKNARLMSAAVPAELGGDGLDQQNLSKLLRMIARACSSTALAYSMHTHVAALLAWRWRNQKAPVDAVLKRIAAEQIALISSGGSDWLESSGTASRAEGGFLIKGTKGFASGVTAGTLLNTSAVYDDPEAGPTVLHFMVPLSTKEVTIETNWRAMGMRGTGSHQVHIDGFFVADAAIALKRPRGNWHPLFHIISMIAFPLIYSVYYGVAEAMRDAALETVKRRPLTPQLIDLVGSLDSELAAARVALADMLVATNGQPGPDTTNRMFQDRSNLARALLATADKALELAHGGGYLRTGPVERLFRDIQAARYHPLAPYAQRDLAGRMALGLPLDGKLC